MTLDGLAQALRGMPRNAKMLVELPDGYSILLCVEDRAGVLPPDPGLT